MHSARNSRYIAEIADTTTTIFLMACMHQNVETQADVDTPLRKETSSGRSYALAMLSAVAAVSVIDRQVITILMQPIKAEFGASDAAMGALAGLAFAIFYVIAGFPLARLADRGVRRTIIAISLSVWSLFTLLCGFAQSYVHLLLARIGVAVGESGGMPATHSMVADLYPLSRRGFAISIIGASGSLGSALGVYLGGELYQLYGWRGAFMALAVPGLILAAIFRLSVREPARVLPHNNSKDTTPPLREVASTLWRIKSFRSFLVGGFGLSFAGVGMLVWAPTFLMRVHHATPQEAGQMFGLAVAVGLCGGQLASGYLADRLGQRDVRWYAWLGGVGAVLAAPFGLGFLFVPDQMTAMVAFAIYLLLMSCWNVPFLAICLTMAPPRTRAMVSALYVMCVNLGGIGLGSVFVGAMNDVLTSRYGPEAIRHSLTLVMGVSVLAGLACALASRWLRDDVRSSALSQDA